MQKSDKELIWDLHDPSFQSFGRCSHTFFGIICVRKNGTKNFSEDCIPRLVSTIVGVFVLSVSHSCPYLLKHE